MAPVCVLIRSKQNRNSLKKMQVVVPSYMCLFVCITLCRKVLVSELEECGDQEIGVYLWGVWL